MYRSYDIWKSMCWCIRCPFFNCISYSLLPFTSCFTGFDFECRIGWRLFQFIWSSIHVCPNLCHLETCSRFHLEKKKRESLPNSGRNIMHQLTQRVFVNKLIPQTVPDSNKNYYTPMNAMVKLSSLRFSCQSWILHMQWKPLCVCTHCVLELLSLLSNTDTQTLAYVFVDNNQKLWLCLLIDILIRSRENI